MLILGLCGAARCGKDTAAEALVANGWVAMAFADPVREGLLSLNPTIDADALLPWFWPTKHISLRQAVEAYGWERVKALPEVRGMLQRFGTEAGRDIHGHDCWVAVADRRLARLAPDARVVFKDVRFPEECAYIHRQGGRVWRIERPGHDGQLRGETERHRSEHSLTPDHWDAVIANDGPVGLLKARVLGLSAGLLLLRGRPSC